MKTAVSFYTFDQNVNLREACEQAKKAGYELDDETRERLAELLTAAGYASAELPADGNGTLLVFVIGQS